MRVLIVEDNAFNAFCLTRLFAAARPDANVTVVTDSYAALQKLESVQMDLIILDGDLAAGDGCYCNGPVLADLIWRKFSNSIIAAWTDNQIMRKGFAEVFEQHTKPFNHYSCWDKMITQKQLLQALIELGIESDRQSLYQWASSQFLPIPTDTSRGTDNSTVFSIKSLMVLDNESMAS